MSERPAAQTEEAVGATPQDSRLYDEGYYATYEGGSYDRGGHWTRFFGYIADEVVARWAPQTTLDAGCALGVFVEELRARGVEAWGVDVSEYAVSQAADAVRPFVRVGSLAAPLPEGLPQRYDLVSCIEVVEHMDAAEGQLAIAQLCAVTDRVLFSSTPDGHGEPTHFTCRPAEEWSALFARHGFVREWGAEATFLAPWAVVYVRRDPTPYQLVLEYDRELARVEEERRQLRERVVQMDRELSSRTAAAGEPGAYQGDASDEVARLRVELMDARDQLAERDVTPGAAAARLRDELRAAEERSYERARADLAARLRPHPVGRAVLSAARRLRGPRP